jgi:hypothetical protein
MHVLLPLLRKVLVHLRYLDLLLKSQAIRPFYIIHKAFFLLGGSSWSLVSNETRLYNDHRSPVTTVFRRAGFCSDGMENKHSSSLCGKLCELFCA